MLFFGYTQRMLKNLSIEKFFLLTALIFGILYVFILPPFQSVDEGMHFYRTHQISESKFLAKNVNGITGDELPVSLSNFYNMYTPFIKNIDKKSDMEILRKTFDISIQPQNRIFTEFRNTALYSPVCYISQLPGVILGKLLTQKLALTYYLGRLSNLLFYAFLVFWAIKIIPFYKLPLLCLALLPMSLSLAGAYTCDVAVLGLNFLWVAMLLKTLTSDYPLKIFDKQILTLLCVALLMAFSKSYILLLPLIFLLPVCRFKTQKDYIISLFLIIFAAIAGLLYWSFCIKGLTLNMNDCFANSDLQIEFIKTHPLQYLSVLIKTFFIKTPRLYITMVGVLGWQDTKLDWITYIIYPFLIYSGMKAENFNFRFYKWQKAVILLTVIAAVLITYTSLYIMWSPVANAVVLGLNGKYFIPLILPLLCLFPPPRMYSS